MIILKWYWWWLTLVLMIQPRIDIVCTPLSAVLIILSHWHLRLVFSQDSLSFLKHLACMFVRSTKRSANIYTSRSKYAKESCSKIYLQMMSYSKKKPCCVSIWDTCSGSGQYPLSAQFVITINSCRLTCKGYNNNLQCTATIVEQLSL